MNGIKKAFSHRRRSSGGSSLSDRSTSTTNTTPETSPRQVSDKKLASTTAATKPTTATGTTAGTGAGVAAGTAAATGAGVAATKPRTTGTTGTTGATTTENKILGTTEADKKAVVPDGTGVGRSQAVAEADGTHAHTRGHGVNVEPSDLKGKVYQDVMHLNHITDETRQRHHIEEVQRERDLQTHHHHVQHHVQKIIDTEHLPEQQHEKLVPITHIQEKHASTTKDAELLAAVARKHGYTDVAREAAEQHTIVDQGERVNEVVHHHVHNVIQPVIVKDTHEHHRTKTIIPTRHEVHHAPIVHESIVHDAIPKSEFLKSGGVLGSTVTSVHDANVLNTGKCDRTVEGVSEQLEKELKLAPSKLSEQPTAL